MQLDIDLFSKEALLIGFVNWSIVVIAILIFMHGADDNDE